MLIDGEWLGDCGLTEVSEIAADSIDWKHGKACQKVVDIICSDRLEKEIEALPCQSVEYLSSPRFDELPSDKRRNVNLKQSKSLRSSDTCMHVVFTHAHIIHLLY